MNICQFLAADALQCIEPPFARPVFSVCLSMTSRSTVNTVRDSFFSDIQTWLRNVGLYNSQCRILLFSSNQQQLTNSAAPSAELKKQMAAEIREQT